MAGKNKDEIHLKEENTLEHVLVALQKSLSRVNSMSSKVPKNQPRALIIGDLNFEISLKCEQDEDKLRVTGGSGGIDISLKGVINTDIEFSSEEVE